VPEPCSRPGADAKSKLCFPDSEKDWQYMWMYIVAPFTGAILAGMAHRLHLASFKIIVPVESKVEEQDVIHISIN